MKHNLNNQPKQLGPKSYAQRATQQTTDTTNKITTQKEATTSILLENEAIRNKEVTSTTGDHLKINI